MTSRRPPLSRQPEDQPRWDEVDEVLGLPDPADEDRYRAMRRLPPEVDEYGAATFAEQTRMMTGPEPGTFRLRKVPDDDPWYGGNAA